MEEEKQSKTLKQEIRCSEECNSSSQNLLLITVKTGIAIGFSGVCVHSSCTRRDSDL